MAQHPKVDQTEGAASVLTRLGKEESIRRFTESAMEQISVGNTWGGLRQRVLPLGLGCVCMPMMSSELRLITSVTEPKSHTLPRSWNPRGES